MMLALALLAASPTTVALVVGNNAKPAEESELSDLRFADDDAIRFYNLFRRTTDHVELLTVVDDTSQARHPRATRESKPPGARQVDEAVDRLAKILTAARGRGEATRAYITFSGHGSTREDGEPYLALLDDALTGAGLFERVIGRLPADRIHVIIDSCNAGAVVGVRGRFDQEAEAEPVELGREALAALAEDELLSRYPHVGVIVAASAGQEAHEWTRIESGVFTHEVLSALAGPADINGDLAIEYSELQAFIASANSAVQDPRAKPTIVARAPVANRRSPILALAELRDTAFIRGRPPGRFFVELGNGQRFLDAHVGPESVIALAIPADTPVYLRTADREASIARAAGTVIDFDELELQAQAVASRGATDETFQRELFAVPYGPTYYRGYVDSQSLMSVEFDGVQSSLLEPGLTTDELIAYGAWGVGAGGLTLAVVASVLAADARSSFDDTSIQRTATELADDYDRWVTLAWVGAGIAAAGAAAGCYFYPKGAPTPIVVTDPSGAQAFGLSIGGEF